MNCSSIIFLSLIFIFISNSSEQRIIKSQWTNGYSTYSTQFDLKSGSASIQFYVWILPQVGNTLTNKMEIARISSTPYLNTANELASKILLISVNTSTQQMLIESFAQVFTLELKGLYQSPKYYYQDWLKISITLSKTSIAVISGQKTTTINISDISSIQQFYFQMGLEFELSVLPLNGYYFFDDSVITLPNVIASPPSTTDFTNQGFSNQISYMQSLGNQKIKTFESSQKQLRPSGPMNDQIIFQYSIKLGLQITGNFLTQKQIFRMTMDPSLNDERNLGYCVICIYIQQNTVLFTTYQFENGIFSQKKLQVQIQNIDPSKIYQYVVQYDGTNFSIFDDQKGLVQQIQIFQTPLMGFTVISGGNFLSNGLYSGILNQVMVNYGQQQLVQQDISQFLTCSNKYCAVCSLDSKTCISCIISDADPNKNTNSCDCNASYFLDINSKCSKCFSTCASCNGPSPNQCTQCINTRELLPGQQSGTCVCSSKYFDDNFNSICQPCYKDCLTCNGYGSSNCQTCGKGRAVNQNGECICQSNYFKQGDDCIQCNKLCQTCNAATTCQTCGENQTLDPQTQLCKCKIGFYPVQEGDFTKCYACTEFCDYCQGPEQTKCTQCNNKFNLFYDKGSTSVGSCVYKKYIPTQKFNSSFNFQSEQAIQYCVLVMIIVDFLANIYSNRYTFSRVFRMQQFLLKIFYLKLIDTDFVQSNYILLNALSFFNGITNVFYYINPFGSIPTLPKAQDRVKIKLEQVSSEILNSCGGVLFVAIILFIITLIMTLIVKCRTKVENRLESVSVFSNPNDNSMRIEQPIVSSRNQNENDNHDTIKHTDFISKLNYYIQNIYWHFNDYAINIFCFGCILHLAGPPQEQQQARADNFICYFILIYIFFVYLLLRSWLILKPKQKDDLLKDKEQAIKVDKILQKRDRRVNRYSSPLIEQEHQNNENSDFNDVLAGQHQNQESASSSEQHQSNGQAHRSNSVSSQTDSESSQKEPVILPNYKKWHEKLILHDSVCLNGIFECLHMEYIPMQKGCKFYFWIYVLNYFSVSASIIGPIDNSTSQYVSLAIVQFVFIIFSLFRPYQDTLESLKNIIDNVIYFIVVVLQCVQSWLVSNNSADFILYPSKETLINSYSWASFSLLLIVLISFMGLSIAQIFTKKKYLVLLEEQIQNENRIKQQQLEQEQNEINLSVTDQDQIQKENDNEQFLIDSQLANQFREIRQQQGIFQNHQIEMQNFNNGSSLLVTDTISRRRATQVNENTLNTNIDQQNVGMFDYSSRYIQSANRHRNRQQTGQNFNTLRVDADYFTGGFATDQNYGQLQLVSQEFNTQLENDIRFNNPLLHQQERHSQQYFTNIQNVQSLQLLPNLETNSGNPEDSDNSNKQPFSSDSDSIGRSQLNEDLILLHKSDKNSDSQINQQQLFHQVNSPSEQFNINQQEYQEKK
ncbi:transmembrane protein, putative (macronuclear) [Tetrahymena thermophila SB210]|uniref:Transmembrane protein, putative n=1 Tax=Tetrahymena thermophila (strain SB210) TaxID=312017 RepID=I7M9C3_TETTS|nr:transmembrane protein, putative [Tetrahymena thermophila SB210]EAS01315.2 transmembrane protein, putative [Tetrahymena thermophila SB210]|eukprot:XP_001021560.2 transmembrane protein, putative [Tetrahymena thermophila SB210]